MLSLRRAGLSVLSSWRWKRPAAAFMAAVLDLSRRLDARLTEGIIKSHPFFFGCFFIRFSPTRRRRPPIPCLVWAGGAPEKVVVPYLFSPGMAGPSRVVVADPAPFSLFIYPFHELRKKKKSRPPSRPSRFPGPHTPTPTPQPTQLRQRRPVSRSMTIRCSTTATLCCSSTTPAAVSTRTWDRPGRACSAKSGCGRSVWFFTCPTIPACAKWRSLRPPSTPSPRISTRRSTIRTSRCV